MELLEFPLKQGWVFCIKCHTKAFLQVARILQLYFSSLVTDCVMDVTLSIVVLHLVFTQSSLCTKTV